LEQAARFGGLFLRLLIPLAKQVAPLFGRHGAKLLQDLGLFRPEANRVREMVVGS
jgi:hypothetical protein